MPVGALAIAGSASALPIIDQLLGGKPAVSSATATSVTSASARLNGSVHPNGHGTKYFFEYGPTIAYGAKTTEGSAGGGSSWKTVSATITALQAGATYHFRLVATNSRGTNRSDDLSFTTAAVPPPGGEPDPGPDPDPGRTRTPGTRVPARSPARTRRAAAIRAASSPASSLRSPTSRSSERAS